MGNNSSASKVIDIDEVSSSVEKMVSSQDFYLQSLTAGICIFIAFLITIGIRTAIRSKFPDSKLRPILRKRVYPLLTPLFSLILISVGYSIASDNIENREYIDYYNKFIILFLLLRLLRVTINSIIIKSLLYAIITPAGILYAFGYLDNMSSYLDEFGFTAGDFRISALTFVKAIFALSVFMWVGRAITNLFSSFIRKQKSINYSTRKLLTNIFDIILYFILAVIGLNFLGIDLTALTVFGGALGVGLGFGLQKIASNFISGIILLLEKSVKQNDLIELEDGTLGWIREMGARATRIETYDGQEIMIPNEEFITKRVTNWTFSNTRGRVTVDIGVSYNSDMNKVKEIITEVAEANESVLNEPRAKVHMREYGDNSVNFKLLYWVADITEERWGSVSSVMFDIWNKFKEHDIEIPFPQRDLHLKSIDEDVVQIIEKKAQNTVKKPTKS